MTVQQIMFLAVIAMMGLALSSCSHATSIPPALPTVTTEPNIGYSPCTSDQRGNYTTIEVPEITDIGHAPPAFFTVLHAAIMAEGHDRAIYTVVSSTPENDHVAQLVMSVETWKPEQLPTDNNGTLAMQLFLIDKAHRCQVGQTTGAGIIRHDPQNGFDPNDVAAIAESAAWFVGITLMH